ncbi:MAG: O-acetylhomoserine aminocarboxypropyltransferase/cysteine synthase [Deltaproteobacteria bacterium]|jgi:O-acetylhomoserine (thiol)-lyase|nr:O-acetylhomoserine aminocarboxypropyltransferase/cysteine synthase [Deltaproteobacteria bacterium]
MAAKTDKTAWGFETKQLHVGQEEPDSATGARAVPIYQTTSYVFRDAAQASARFSLAEPGNIYARLTNPTQDILERRLAALEGGTAALALASGAAAATYSFLNLTQSGDHLVAARTLYGGTYNLLAHALPRYGVSTTFVDPYQEGAFAEAIRPNTRGIFVETLGNPNSNIVDIEALAELAHSHKIPLVVDSTFTPPNLLRPLDLGADVVFHSATKFIGGHGTSLGGVVIDGGFDWEGSGKFPALTEPDPSYHGVSFSQAAGKAAFVTRIRASLLRDTGAAISPFNAFLLLQGVETLSLRVERHVQNALAVVKHLAEHPKVARVHHPSLPDDPSHALYKRYFPNGAGSIFTFEIKGGYADAVKFIDRLQLFSLLANVADLKSLVIHPASTTHSQLNETELAEQDISPSTIRLSIGTENIKDILADLDQALSGL